MKRIATIIALALAATIVLADISIARPVFLKDGGRLEAVSVRKSGEKVYILLNRESQITLYAHEVDLVKTFDKRWEKPVRKPAPSAPPIVKLEEPVLPLLEEGPPEIAPPEPAPAPVVKVETPAPQEPAKATPVPTPVAKPKPAPRPAVTPEPAAPELDFEDGGIVPILILVSGLAFLLVLVASFWKVFTKAGEAGWKSLVPIYNFIVLLKISGTPIWWIVLFFIPVINIGASIFLGINLAKSFGKGALYGFGLCFLSFIFYPHLAFSKATYQY